MDSNRGDNHLQSKYIKDHGSKSHKAYKKDKTPIKQNENNPLHYHQPIVDRSFVYNPNRYSNPQVDR